MDIDKYRQPWESDEHWVFRKEFIITHRERFPNEDRLLCLAQVFANVELLGCSYPKPVMDQINELSREISQVQKLRDKRSERTVVKFVKDTSEGASRYSGTKRGPSGDFRDGPQPKNPHHSSRDHPSVGSAIRATAASLFSADSSGTQIASYYTVKGASQSRHHQGETPLSPSVSSYQSIQFLKSNDSSFGNVGKGERGLPLSASQKPFIVDCKHIRTNNEVSLISPQTDIPSLNGNNPQKDSSTEPIHTKFEELWQELNILMTKQPTNKIQNLSIACSKKKMKITEDDNSNVNVCQESCNRKNLFNCTLFINTILVGFGIASKKKVARNLAYDDAIQKLAKKHIKFLPLNNWNEPVLQLSTSDDGVNFSDQIQRCPCFEKKLEIVSQQSSLVSSNILKKTHESKPIMENSLHNSLETQLRVLSGILEELTLKQGGNKLQIMEMACSKLGLCREYDVYEVLPKSVVKPLFAASLKLAKVVVGKANGSNKKEARLMACKRALSLLSKKHFKVVPAKMEGQPELKLVASDDPSFSLHTCLDAIDPALRLSNDISTVAPTLKSKNYPKAGGLLMNDARRQSRIFNQRSYTPTNQKMSHHHAAPQTNTMLLIDDQFVNHGSNEISRLINSCSLNKTPAEFDFDTSNIDSQLMKRCTVKIAGKIEGIGVGETKQVSKLEACKNALKNLQERVYTVQVKQKVSSRAQQINKYHVQESNVNQDQQLRKNEDNTSIDPDNVGFRMLQMMGWKGGGIGKEESGIETPISVKDVYEREGLGFSELGSLNVKFKTNIQNIITDFAKSDYVNELKFSPDFSKEERKYIHSLAEKYRLKAVSKGGHGSGRYLVLSHKMDPKQLLHCLLARGGSNEKYTLIPPASKQ